MRYDEIRPMSFRFAPNATGMTLIHRHMEFPSRWKSLLKQLQADAQKRPVTKTSLPISDLNRALLALVPDLIHIYTNAGRQDASRWLASSVDIDPNAIQLIALAWVRALFKSSEDSRLNDVLTEMARQPLVWETEAVDLTDWASNESGTAKPGHPAQFDLIPAYIAARLSQPHVSFQLSHETLHFIRAPLSPGHTGTELISWPPLAHTTGSSQHFYSYVIGITVQTVPFVSYPCIYFRFGLRRWVSTKTGPRRTRASVYLLTSVPWLPALHYTSSFQIARTKWARTSEGFVMRWADHLVEILETLSTSQPFPEPRELFQDPRAALNLGSSPNVAAVFSYGMKPQHPTKPGVTPADRHRLLEQITAFLKPELELTEAFPRVGGKRRRLRTNPFRQAADENVVGDRVRLIAQASSERVRFEVLYDQRTTLQAFLRYIGEMLGSPADWDKRPVQLKAGNLDVIVDWRTVGSIGDSLLMDERIKSQRDRRQRAAEDKMRQIAAGFGEVHEPTVTYVELAGENAFDAGTDPKQAIRIGLARTGRLSQFFDKTSDTSPEHRVERAVLDSLRQLGLFRQPDLTVQGIGLLDHVGVWLVKPKRGKERWMQTEYIPVFVYLDSEESRVYATAPGLDGWKPYHQALLAIGQQKAKGFDAKSRALNYIERQLRTEIDPGRNTLLICHSQNLRSTWPWLQDGRLCPDEPSFGEGREWSIGDWPGLRLVRVRDSERDETPQWYATDNDKYGHSKGLFRINYRVFAITYGNPYQFKRVSNKATKVEQPNMQAWNPRMYELVVAGAQTGDDITELAMSAHVSRDAHIQYDDATALPLVLHLGKLTEEYIYTAYEEADEDDEE